VNDPATILIVDDIPDNIRLLGAILQPNYQLLIANNGKEAITLAQEKSPDLILLDVMMPEMNGYEVCQRLRDTPGTRDIPIIFVTAMDQIEDEVMGLEIGAIDYLTKPVHPLITRLRVKNQLELKRYRDHLLEMSRVDGLTGIANRRRLDEYLEQEWRRSTRGGSPLSLVMMDIDFFKRFNDHYGHQGGDECLQRVARCLQGCVVRSVDLIARYGGEEFACLLPETGHGGTELMGEKLRQAVTGLGIPHAKSSVVDIVTLSLGAATLVPEPGMASSELIKIADENLYAAKNQGRNRLIC
jgi:diguanylate cyclase (GGDEF)-like protein